MLYSKLYKEHYPFKSSSDILSLNKEERIILIKYIGGYYPRAVEAIHKAWKYGWVVEGYPRPKGTIIACSKRLGAITAEFGERGKNLITKINSRELLTNDELATVNRILYSNKYCSVLTWFLDSWCWLPDGQEG